MTQYHTGGTSACNVNSLEAVGQSCLKSQIQLHESFGLRPWKRTRMTSKQKHNDKSTWHLLITPRYPHPWKAPLEHTSTHIIGWVLRWIEIKPTVRMDSNAALSVLTWLLLVWSYLAWPQPEWHCKCVCNMYNILILYTYAQLSDIHIGRNVSCRWGTGPASIRSSTSTTVEVQVDDIENKWVTKYGPVVSNPWEFTIEGSIHTACVSRWCIIFMSAFWTLASLGFLLEKKKTWRLKYKTLSPVWLMHSTKTGRIWHGSNGTLHVRIDVPHSLV